MIAADHMALHEEQESGLHHRYAVTVQNAMFFFKLSMQNQISSRDAKEVSVVSNVQKNTQDPLILTILWHL